jgi:NAD(P)-dependent dehydrogenase (short-subunit alcohol dehydrogenase family)
VLAKEVAPVGIKVTVVEPGGMRTDWAGSSMHIDAIRSEYQPTVGVLTQMRGNTDVMRGDPKKVAQAIIRIASEPQPPVRLLIGSDAVFLAGQFAAARAQEDATWKALSLSTDFDGLGDFTDTPIAKHLAAMQS